MRVMLDAQMINEKESAHAYLQEKFGFPEHYGRNLDAFYDCLTELDDTEVYIVNKDKGGDYFQEIYQVLLDACRDNERLCMDIEEQEKRTNKDAETMKKGVETMKLGILGAGMIAELMADTIKGLPEVEAYAVASRSMEKAEAFAKQHGFTKAYGSYEEMLKDDAVDLVYVATPHSHHLEHGKLCISYGKNILVEKAFTQNAQQARELLAYAKEKGVLVTEAIWTRYMPSRQMIHDLVESGIIGDVYSLHATLSYPITFKERIMRPELAGGSLLDIGIYALNFASMVFGGDVQKIDASALLADTGVDLATSVTLHYADGKTATLFSDVRVADNREGAIYGEKGYIMVQNINNCEMIRVYDEKHNLLKEVAVPEQITGYEYEILACMEAIKKGELECPQMPHEETIRMMEMMDEIREKIGVVYPNEI